jgi:HAD superfamily hydrolase (TIGR01509 family)
MFIEWMNRVFDIEVVCSGSQCGTTAAVRSALCGERIADVMTCHEFEAVVFDFDGVVADTEPLYVRAETRFFRDYGKAPSSEQWKQFKGISEHRFYQMVIDDFHIPETVDSIRVKMWNYLKEEFRGNLRCIEGFERLLSRLEDRYLLGLVTSTRRELLDYIFREMNFPDCFQQIVTVDDVEKGKPHPEPYLAIAARFGIDPSRMVVIEDSVNGLMSARKAGAAAIGLTSSFDCKELTLAHQTVDSLDEITEPLLSLLYRKLHRHPT